MNEPPDPSTARDALRITTDNFTLADEECDAFIYWLRTGDSALLESYYQNLPVPESHKALLNERAAAADRGETKVLTSEEVHRDLMQLLRDRRRERERQGVAWINFDAEVDHDESQEDGPWFASLPGLPGVVGSGTTRAEALADVEHLARELVRQTLQESRQKKLFDQIGNIFPLLLDMLAEGKSEVLKDPAFKLQIKTLLSSLDEQQLASVIKRLDPAHQVAFLELYRQLREDEKAEENP